MNIDFLTFLAIYLILGAGFAAILEYDHVIVSKRPFLFIISIFLWPKIAIQWTWEIFKYWLTKLQF